MSAKDKLIALVGVTAASGALYLTTASEGTVLKVYKDPVGILTSCMGHTGPELKLGQTFTLEQCQEQQYADLLKHAAALDCVKTPLTDGEKAAYLSFAYNVGVSNFCKSTLVKLKNDGRSMAACDQLLRWVMPGTNLEKGLRTRRNLERSYCVRNL
ncbi:lysozyme [Undibacterium sp. Di26W]|uniref:lysozyme n=1 Tax=Undibacterium sp. Di26W TaxID=3413035 RepID=UPI003BF25566